MGVSLTGNDTTIIDTRILRDFGNGDVVNIEFPNNLSETKAGKNGNAIFAYNAQGNLANVTLRLLRGSADDKYMASRTQEYKNDPAAFVMFSGEFIKRLGDGSGAVTSEIYQMKGGVVQKIAAAKENVEGDTEQAIAIYVLTFGNATRIMG